ncbi:hypothetical protein [Mucilaginibacter lacusdianchii]|uniref:hypothetical protein n=1 Tax=Mucilaginibacter lacusdianchii TaxID=2684211 RepID=UPI00131C29F8|nr:hypothetical protein [Mucilaginibacter sp. JXJ CY 39]
MQFILRIIKKHLAAILAYIAYLWLLISQIKLHFRFAEASSHIGEGERIAWGEGIMYGWLLLIGIGVGTGIVMFLNAMIYRDNRLFYLFLSLGFIAPVVLLVANELNQ